MSQVMLPGWLCARCGHKWPAKPLRRPVKCPSCNSPYWDRPRKGRGKISGLQVVEGVGYYTADIATHLGPDRFEAFGRWMSGQTMALSKDGRTLVYPGDLAKFLRGEAVSD